MQSGFGRRVVISRADRTSVISGAGMSASGDNRFAPRRSSLIPAQIYFDGTTVTLPCVIRDTSTTGARVELRSGWDSPSAASASESDRVRLVIRADRILDDCRIVRRNANELGLRFMAAPKPMTRVVR